MEFRKLSLIVLLAFFSAATCAIAADVQWFGGAHDRSWFNTANWGPTGGPIPTDSDKAKINFVWNNDGPVIWQPGAVAYQIYVSEDRDLTTLGNQSVTVTTGGVLTTSSLAECILGYYGPDTRAGYPANDGSFIMNGGIANLNGNFFVGFSGTGSDGGKGHVTVNGGDLNIGQPAIGMFGVGWNGGQGDVTLNGGVLHSEAFNLSPLAPGKASMNICGGTWIEEHYWVPDVNALVNNGTIKAYGGNGKVSVAWDPIAQRTIVTSIASLWDFNSITVTANSPVIVPPGSPNSFIIANMFEQGLTQDANVAIFMDGAGPGALYYTEWNTAAPARVNTFDVHFQSDAGTNNRAVKHFTLKAKSAGSSTYDQILYDADVALPYAAPNYTKDIVFTLPTPVVAQYFRAEFTGASDAAAGSYGPRIREMNATGTYPTPVVHEFDYKKMLVDIINSSPAIQDPNRLLILKNMFEGGNDTKQTIFQNYATDPNFPYPAGHVYGVNWTMPTAISLKSFMLKASHDGAPTYARAISHFTLKAKSPGSSTYDRTVYDAAVTVPYDPNGFIGKVVALAKPVVAKDFRVEFTSNDTSGPRIWELDGLGSDNASVTGDLNNNYSVDFKDYSTFAANWNSSAASQNIQNFEGYSSLPKVADNTTPTANTWSVGYGHGGAAGGFFSPVPNAALSTSVAHGGTKSVQWSYSTVDAFDPCTAAYNNLTYALTSTIDLSTASAVNVWIKRAATNPAEARLDVRFLRNNYIMAYSNAIAGSTADANSLWTQVSLPVSALNTTGRTIDLLTGIDSIQFHIDKGVNQLGHSGTIYIDDIVLVPVLAGDLNGDGKVDLLDVALFTQNWLAGK